MEAARPFFHGIASAIQLVGLGLAAFGGLRLIRAPGLAAQRAAAQADRSDEQRASTARGLTDFYRISGAIAVVAGIILILVPIFAA